MGRSRHSRHPGMSGSPKSGHSAKAPVQAASASDFASASRLALKEKAITQRD